MVTQGCAKRRSRNRAILSSSCIRRFNRLTSHGRQFLLLRVDYQKTIIYSAIGESHRPLYICPALRPGKITLKLTHLFYVFWNYWSIRVSPRTSSSENPQIYNMATKNATLSPEQFNAKPRTDSGLRSIKSNYSIISQESTASTRFDSTEVVFNIPENNLTFEPKKDLTTKTGQPRKILFTLDEEKLTENETVQGVQTVEIQKFSNVVQVTLGQQSKGEASVDYATVRLPKKVFRNRLRGHYKELYIRSSG